MEHKLCREMIEIKGEWTRVPLCVRMALQQIHNSVLTLTPTQKPGREEGFPTQQQSVSNVRRVVTPARRKRIASTTSVDPSLCTSPNTSMNVPQQQTPAISRRKALDMLKEFHKSLNGVLPNLQTTLSSLNLKTDEHRSAADDVLNALDNAVFAVSSCLVSVTSPEERQSLGLVGVPMGYSVPFRPPALDESFGLKEFAEVRRESHVLENVSPKARKYTNTNTSNSANVELTRVMKPKENISVSSTPQDSTRLSVHRPSVQEEMIQFTEETNVPVAPPRIPSPLAIEPTDPLLPSPRHTNTRNITPTSPQEVLDVEAAYIHLRPNHRSTSQTSTATTSIVHPPNISKYPANYRHSTPQIESFRPTEEVLRKCQTVDGATSAGQLNNYSFAKTYSTQGNGSFGGQGMVTPLSASGRLKVEDIVGSSAFKLEDDY